MFWFGPHRAPGTETAAAALLLGKFIFMFRSSVSGGGVRLCGAGAFCLVRHNSAAGAAQRQLLRLFLAPTQRPPSRKSEAPPRRGRGFVRVADGPVMAPTEAGSWFFFGGGGDDDDGDDDDTLGSVLRGRGDPTA